MLVNDGFMPDRCERVVTARMQGPLKAISGIQREDVLPHRIAYRQKTVMAHRKVHIIIMNVTVGRRHHQIAVVHVTLLVPVSSETISKTLNRTAEGGFWRQDEAPEFEKNIVEFQDNCTNNSSGCERSDRVCYHMNRGDARLSRQHLRVSCYSNTLR
jgi:hypothetical protein